MGYRVDYRPVKKIRYAENRYSRVLGLTALFFLLFLLLINFFWTDGAAVLREVFIPGDTATTVSALRNLTADLQEGISFPAAVEAFCVFVIKNAETAVY